MAIDANIPYPDTDELAQTEKGFYQMRIPVSHWQLRHYISTPEQDHLYYASAHDIFCLNTVTKKRKHIATLPFEARCTASGYGYVCVGGEEEGHFATIKLDGSGQRTLDVDSALPIDGWRPQHASLTLGRRAPTVKVERIGEEIVNSISIHRIQDEEAHLDDIVAVLTNNDKTVRVYSLPLGQETRVKDLPFAINHATISPDGTVMVAVGDYNQAYFFTRDIVDTPPQIPKPHNRLTSASVDWRLTNVVTLHVSSPDATVGYFTSAWSPSGTLVAVGSEGGYITVIDAEILADPEYEDDEAIVAVVPGSRADFPSPHPGAIRSMVFSPEPWDLLVWAEDQGRICIGDLRTGLKSKQTINLEPKEETLTKLAFEDIPSEEPTHLDDLEAELLRRYRNVPENTSAVNFATEYIEARRRQRQQRQDLAHGRSQTGTPASRQTPDGDDPQGLTSREQQILEALRTSRQREEARAGGQIPRSVNYTTPDMFNHRSSASPSNADSGRPISEILSSVQESLPELSRIHAASPRPSSSHATESNDLPPLHALQDGIWGSSARSGLPRIGETSRLPRRRQSVVLNPPVSNSGSSASAGNGNGANRGQFSTPGATSAEVDDENPWRSVEEQMSVGRGPLFESAARAQAGSPLPASDRVSPDSLQQELDAQRRIALAQSRARDRWRTNRLASNGASSSAVEREALTLAQARRIANFPEGYEALRMRSGVRGYSGREIGVRTAGLAMSPDGAMLWAACEAGIFEINMRRKGRMFYAALEPR
ncbi:hypothetical protein M409DRAFT_68249 [Zasmidium cellare ATCC 36951]|uniref:DUF2415 domain-containing protein n=1 Tax=Zasmidium cellare ATCC 36951 TaxID=1080233 RepID=A0A6A6CA52_ZASCE|nr:uncharacterized protein M409DRAFT_68249 [Zasmidium cellare ATCC 36951]KAF2164034.1 hypothetical protein M409DRAFT_68249 [Zasmidium cellare ATCC 36951]